MKNNDEKLIEAILKNLLLFAAVKIKYINHGVFFGFRGLLITQFINLGNIHAINIAMFMR